METKVINDHAIAVAGNDHVGASGAGLTAVPDALLVIFDRIEQEVADACRLYGCEK
ncbi:MAG: hypothetical protein JWN94_2253 [Betaproteobacteria bacterium]|nr:hypothetical protein [Betaproteobacteria bacterium]